MKKSSSQHKEVRALGSQGVVEAEGGEKSRKVKGHAAVFNKRSELLFEDGRLFYEIIKPGAFDNTDMTDVRALLNHDSNHLLARTKSNTLQLTPDSDGLAFQFEMPKSRNDVLEMVERGDLDQNSFAFYIANGGDYWEQDGGVEIRYITNIKKVTDITLATYPAYPDTSVSVAQRSYQNWKESQEPEEKENETDYEYEYRSRALQLISHKLNNPKNPF